jgi:HEAT repeat protein
MSNRSLWKRVVVSGLFLILLSSLQAATLEENWNDFLHYTAIGRFELAQTYAQQVIDGEPEPTALLDLADSNPQGYRLLLKVQEDNDQLREASRKILELIEKGRYIRRTDAKIISEEIQRLSTTIRGRIAAEERLRNAGEYAIPQMLAALADEERKNEFAYITEALPKIGRGAIRPLTAALQTENVAVKAEIVRALGKIGYFEPLPYLKLIVEKSDSEALRTQAQKAIEQIDPAALKISAAELFFSLAEKYYNQDDSLAASAEFDFANVWFWDGEKNALIRQEVNKKYFDELMTMRTAEWTLKADPATGKAIGLWIAAYFRAESVGEPMPAYFGEGHADAMTYATTAGAEYLHQALERAIKDEDGYVALGVVEALAVNAGEKSLLFRVGPEQPLAKALNFMDRKVRYSAAIALAEANPVTEFTGRELIVQNLSAAILREGSEELGEETAKAYALRAVEAMGKLAMVRNRIVDLAGAMPALITVTGQTEDTQMQTLAAGVLAYLESPEAQRAVAAMALSEQNADDIRISAFQSLARSAKLNANLLLTDQVEQIYKLVSSTEINPELRAAAAGAYGALNLPSEQVKNLIVDQAKS